MAVSSGPAVPVLTPHAPRNRGFAIGMVIVFIGFFVFMFGTLIAALTWIVHPVIVALVGMGLLTAGGVVAGMSGGDETPAVPPPPPPIQGPASQGPRVAGALSCPNCGAPPRAIDRFGVATCEYCETRFLVH